MLETEILQRIIPYIERDLCSEGVLVSGQVKTQGPNRVLNFGTPFWPSEHSLRLEDAVKCQTRITGTLLHHD
jgi:hypothetical protein